MLAWATALLHSTPQDALAIPQYVLDYGDYCLDST